MVLGASGSASTEMRNDDKLISRMFSYMIAGGILPKDTSFEQAYPVVKALITANSARRQGVPDDEFLVGLMAEMEIITPDESDKPSANVAPQNDIGPAGMVCTDDDKDDEVEDHAFLIQISPNKADIIIAEENAKRTSDNTPSRPPGIDNEIGEDLAHRLELSAVAVEKLQASAKAFGVIRPSDDINLLEKELINLSASKKSFGMVATPIEDGDKTVEDHAAQFLKQTEHLTPDQRMQLLTNMSSSGNAKGQGQPNQQLIRAYDKFHEVQMMLEPTLDEVVRAKHEFETGITGTRDIDSSHNNLYSDIQRKVLDIEKQLMTTAEVTKTFSQIGIAAEKFNIASPSDRPNRVLQDDQSWIHERPLQRRLSFEHAAPEMSTRNGMPRLMAHHRTPIASIPPGSEAVGCPIGAPTVLSPSGSGTVGCTAGGVMKSLVMPKAPPARFSNVHTIDEYAPPPPAGQCQCCRVQSKSRSGQLMIQEQQVNMADSIRKPRRGGNGPQDNQSDDSSSDSNKDKRRTKREILTMMEMMKMEAALRTTTMAAQEEEDVMTKIGSSTADFSSHQKLMTDQTSLTSNPGWRR